MTKMKKVLAVLLVGVFALSLFGCGSVSPSEVTGIYQGEYIVDDHVVQDEVGLNTNEQYEAIYIERIDGENSDYCHGTFEIDGKDIIIRTESGAVKNIYKYKDGKLVDKQKHELIWKDL